MTNVVKVGRFTVHNSRSSEMQQQLPWLNLNLIALNLLLTQFIARALMALPKEMFMKKGETPYAAELGPNLSLPLDVMEDPKLSFNQGPIMKARRPPGVQSLQEWGEMKFPEGKWKGHRFTEAYVSDHKYAMFMASNPKLVSAWALSFHQYVQLRMQVEIQYKEKKLQQEKEMMHQAMSAVMGSDPGRSRDWEVISATFTPMAETNSQSSHGQLKRSAYEVEETIGMATELDAQTKEEKMLRLALLQREMDMLKKEMNDQ